MTTTSIIKEYINNSRIVPSTCLDRTLKGIISYRWENPTLVEYLNKLRIIYYIKRLRYYNFREYKKLLGKIYIITKRKLLKLISIYRYYL